MVDYLELLKRSWKGFRENLVLFLPYFLTLALSLGVIILLGLELLVMLWYTDTTINDWFSLQFLDLIQTTQFMTILIISAIIDLIAVILIKAYIGSMYIGMNKDIIERGKTESSRMFHYGRTYFKRVFIIMTYKILMYLLPLIALVFATIGLYMLSKPAGVIFGVLALFAYIAYAVIISVGLFFVYPIAAWQKGKPLDLIRESFKVVKENLSLSIITVLITLAIGLIFGIVFYLIGMPIGTFASYAITAGIGMIITIIAIYFLYFLIRVILGLILGYVLELFRYSAFIECGSIEVKREPKAPSAVKTVKKQKKK